MPNYIVVTEGVGIETFKKFSEVEKSYSLQKSDFTREGDDFITGLDPQSIMVTKDIKLLETLATESVFGKKKIDWATVIAVTIANFIVITFITGG